jgi:hypothetical protein
LGFAVVTDGGMGKEEPTAAEVAVVEAHLFDLLKLMAEEPEEE